MAQPTNKIDELRARLSAEPKSRLFYPLAEELRKAGRLAEAEQILRDGLASHASYVSAWVSLGRILKEQGKHNEAIEVLKRASTLDPANVVTARLLGESYLAVGDKLEAIKKLKLVHALLPADEELENQIATLDRDLNPPRIESLDLVEAPPQREASEAIETVSEAEPVETGTGRPEEFFAQDLKSQQPTGEERSPTLEEPFGNIGEEIAPAARQANAVFDTTLPAPRPPSVVTEAQEEPPSWMKDLETPRSEPPVPFKSESRPFDDLAEAKEPAAAMAPAFTPEDTSPFGSPSEAVGQASTLDLVEPESGIAPPEATADERTEPSPARVEMPDTSLQRRKIERLRRWLNTLREEAERV